MIRDAAQQMTHVVMTEHVRGRVKNAVVMLLVDQVRNVVLMVRAVMGNVVLVSVAVLPV
ncbi:MAG: hypothetical protein WCF07_13685 [Nitrososphaeraceae archaeon]